MNTTQERIHTAWAIVSSITNRLFIAMGKGSLNDGSKEELLRQINNLKEHVESL